MDLEAYAKLAEGRDCWGCGKVLGPVNLDHYPHPGGWEVAGHEHKQWLFLTCPHCGYQTSFDKLGILRPVPEPR